MNESNITTNNNLEALLSEAGFSFTVVDHCPYPACVVCRPEATTKAA